MEGRMIIACDFSLLTSWKLSAVPSISVLNIRIIVRNQNFII